MPLQDVEGTIKQEAAAVESWLADMKAAFRTKSRASFDSISKRMGDKLQDMQNLKSAFEASVNGLWSDIQSIHEEIEPTIQVEFQPRQ